MQAFVTGSTGLLGSNLIRELLTTGYEVKALVRSTEKADRFLGDTGVTFIQGDMQDVASFAPELEGCDVLFHTAAYFREYYDPGDHWPMLERVNVIGTLKLLEAAERFGVGKVIYTSSAAVLENRPEGPPTDEAAAYNVFGSENLYFRSKIMAEQAIFSFLETHDLPVILILPGWLIGPGDAGPTAAGRLVLNFMEGKIPSIPRGSMNVVDARDVAQAMMRAVEVGVSGARYIVAGRFTPLAEVLQTLETITGTPGPDRQVPYALMLGIAWLSERLSGLRGGTPLVTTQALRTLRNRGPNSSQRAERELQVTFRPLSETICDTIQWFRQYHYI